MWGKKAIIGMSFIEIVFISSLLIRSTDFQLTDNKDYKEQGYNTN